LESEVAPGFPDGDAGVDRAAGRELGVGVPFSGARQKFCDPSENLFQHVGPHDIHGQRQSIPEGARRQQELRDSGGTERLVIRNQRSAFRKQSKKPTQDPPLQEPTPQGWVPRLLYIDLKS